MYTCVLCACIMHKELTADHKKTALCTPHIGGLAGDNISNVAGMSVD